MTALVSLAPLVEDTFLAKLRSAEALSGVSITYLFPTAGTPQERLWLGGHQMGRRELAAMRSGRKPRRETFTIELYLEVDSPGDQDDPTIARDRAYELLGAVEDVLANDPTLGLTADGVHQVELGEIERDMGRSRDQAGCGFAIDVNVTGRLS